MGHEPTGQFITSMVELKLDTNTMFEWQQYSQDSSHYQKLLDFINLRAQACEASVSDEMRSALSDEVMQMIRPLPLSLPTLMISRIKTVVCKNEKHPLYACTHVHSSNHLLTRIKSPF